MTLSGWMYASISRPPRRAAAAAGRGAGARPRRPPGPSVAVTSEHRQPVALPPPRRPGQRVQPDGAADDPVGQAHDVNRRRVLVVGVPVVARPAGGGEQALL